MRRTFCLVVAAAGMLTASLAAHASTITIDFNTLSGANDSIFHSYTENGFTVTSSANSYYVAQGINGTFGDPAPDIFTVGTGTLTITDGGQPFSLDSFDLGFFYPGSIPYTVTGLNGGESVFSTSGSATENSSEAFLPITGFSSDPLTSLTITLNGASVGGANIDNIVLTTDSPVSSSPVPEPSSFLMLGTGLLGVVGMMRKRFS